MVIFTEVAVYQVAGRVDQLGVGQDHRVVVDADQVALAEGGIREIQTEEVAYHDHRQVGYAISHDGLSGIALTGDLLPAGAVFQIKGEHLL